MSTEQVVDRLEAAKIQVGAKRTEQVGEWLARNIETARGVGQSKEYRMARRAGVG